MAQDLFVEMLGLLRLTARDVDLRCDARAVEPKRRARTHPHQTSLQRSVVITPLQGVVHLGEIAPAGQRHFQPPLQRVVRKRKKKVGVDARLGGFADLLVRGARRHHHHDCGQRQQAAPAQLVDHVVAVVAATAVDVVIDHDQIEPLGRLQQRARLGGLSCIAQMLHAHLTQLVRQQAARGLRVRQDHRVLQGVILPCSAAAHEGRQINRLMRWRSQDKRWHGPRTTSCWRILTSIARPQQCGKPRAPAIAASWLLLIQSLCAPLMHCWRNHVQPRSRSFWHAS